MPQPYTSPGVYREEVFQKPPPALQTGVPAFVGFAGPLPGVDARINQPVPLSRKEEFAALYSTPGGSFLADAIAGFFDNGGPRCYVVAADAGSKQARDLVTAIGALAPLDDMDLLACPDAATLSPSDGIGVQGEMLAHCAEQGNRFAILDSLPKAGVDDVKDQCQQLLLGHQEPLNGALYYPWLITLRGAVPGAVPPCGHVAGIYGSTDARRGVFKAPANEEIVGALDLETQIDGAVQGDLNPARVNCLRAFPGRGIRVWGARTIGSPSELDPWLYVNVRRLFLTVRRWIDFNMGWATFEPNDARLWVRIQRELTIFLAKVQRAGGLKGAGPADGFYVKCDGENNPPEVRDLGQVVIEIGLAPLAPSEFIVVRITRSAGATPDN
jgi:phage tail sheath protein FI